jgi:hypothetical protein
MARNKQAARHDGVSRREFARRAVLAASAAALPASVVAQGASGAQSQPGPAPAPDPERKLQDILARYGNRLSEAQKADLRRLLSDQAKSLDALRAFSLDNSDQPATVLRLAREKS